MTLPDKRFLFFLALVLTVALRVSQDLKTLTPSSTDISSQQRRQGKNKLVDANAPPEAFEKIVQFDVSSGVQVETIETVETEDFVNSNSNSNSNVNGNRKQPAHPRRPPSKLVKSNDTYDYHNHMNHVMNSNNNIRTTRNRRTKTTIKTKTKTRNIRPWHTPVRAQSNWIVNTAIKDRIFRPLQSASSTTTTTTTTTTTKGTDDNNNVNTTIRSWGCHRTETPLIFVHIGKAGGGKVRARFAASAQNYNRAAWNRPGKDEHYYPINNHSSNQHQSKHQHQHQHQNQNQTKAKGIFGGSKQQQKYDVAAGQAKFCTSTFAHHRHPNSTIWPKSFEGNIFCNATTPMGAVLACPEAKRQAFRCLACRDLRSQDCHTVYVGHNNMGSELHWLPPKYLQKWWESTKWGASYKVPWDHLMPKDQRWCRDQGLPLSRPSVNDEMMRAHYWKCGLPIALQTDQSFLDFWKQAQQENQPQTTNAEEQRPSSVQQDDKNKIDNTDTIINFSPLYASMPVHRTTLLREPWSWLVSKYVWHRRYLLGIRCDDIDAATKVKYPFMGWVAEDCLHYIAQLCGDDCVMRLEHGLLSLEEMEAQTAANLRQAFSVVGLLNETNNFYTMMTQRIAYVNMSLNPHVQGMSHSTANFHDTERCKAIYSDTTFQEEMKKRLPVLAVLERLYQVGVEVNRFQREELRQCVAVKQ